MPSISGYSFLLKYGQKWNGFIRRVNAQYLGLFISTELNGYRDENDKRVNAQYLGLFISTTGYYLKVNESETC